MGNYQAISLTEEFSFNPEIVDPRISDRIKLIVDPLSVGIIQSDTVGVPLIGSISNIFATLSHTALEFLPGGGSLIGQMSGGLLLVEFAMALINRYAPTLSKFPPLSWINSVKLEFAKNFSSFKDVIKPI